MSSTGSVVNEKGDLILEKSEDAVLSAESLSVGVFENYFDAEEDRRVLRKIDWHVIPYVSFLYLLSFLDRSTMGNAKVVGLVSDLKLKGLQYNICAAVFFITYSAIEIPSNIALKLVQPSIWIPSIMLAQGVVTTHMSQVKSYHGLLIARLFLGVVGGGLFPGVNFYLIMWYWRQEQAFRIALSFSAATVAGAFGRLLAAALAMLDGKGGLAGWSWILLVEGLFTTVVSGASYFLMHDYPDTAKFLTESERGHVIERLRRDTPALASRVDRRFVYQAFKDYKSHLLVVMYIGVVIPVCAFSPFLPTIITGLGYTAVRAQLLSVPPLDLSCITYVIALGAHASGTKYAGTMIAAFGAFPTVPCSISWTGNNVGGDLKRGVVLATVLGVCSSFIYLAKESPRYQTGHATVIGSLGMLIIVTLVLIYDYSRSNKQKMGYCARERIGAGRAKEFEDMGDASPLFRYVL
ncbi:hypothetical protein FRB99_008936 [Tulasnella sp. 403]|nr:hypothetical protein FRB99_008936 [Tulasnella sp. 403]